MDYAGKIDAQTWEFIRRTEESYPPDAAKMSIAEQRALYDRMCREFFAGYPDGVTARDETVDGVRIRRYRAGPPPAAAAVYFHGGGFVVGGLESHDDVCAEICGKTGFEVASVDYRLCPEHPHPAAFRDAMTVARWADRTLGVPVVLVGDSAGGNLAAAVAHMGRGTLERVAGQVLIYPGLGGDPDAGSYLEHAQAPMLTRDDVLFYQTLRHPGNTDALGPDAAPLRDADFSGLPPTALFVAECDPLADDGRVYRDRILAAGGAASLTVEPGLVHGYLRARTTVRRARESFDRIVAAIDALGRGRAPDAAAG